jgi:hypothetical protein
MKLIPIIIRINTNIIRRALVPYNTALATVMLAAGNNPIAIMPTSGDWLARACHNQLQWNLLNAHNGRDVPFVRENILETQLDSHRDSYINACLIQSRGHISNQPCTTCAARFTADPLRTAFPECVRAPGHFGGACGNCKWLDHGRRCSFFVAPPRSGRSRSRGRGNRGGRGGGQQSKNRDSGNAGRRRGSAPHVVLDPAGGNHVSVSR